MHVPEECVQPGCPAGRGHSYGAVTWSREELLCSLATVLWVYLLRTCCSLVFILTNSRHTWQQIHTLARALVLKTWIPLNLFTEYTMFSMRNVTATVPGTYSDASPPPPFPALNTHNTSSQESKSHTPLNLIQFIDLNWIRLSRGRPFSSRWWYTMFNEIIHSSGKKARVALWDHAA